MLIPMQVICDESWLHVYIFLYHFVMALIISLHLISVKPSIQKMLGYHVVKNPLDLLEHLTTYF